MRASILILMLCTTSLLFAQQPKPGKKPAWQTPEEKALRDPFRNENLYKQSLNKTLPEGVICPGEFEESQAVAISWSFDYDTNGNPIGIDVTSEYGDISAQLADALQKECTVWIRVLSNSDTTLVKNYMNSVGKPLTNYRFLVAPGDDWWTRDYGPMAVYTKNLDSIAFVDMKYYDGRDKDNVFPGQLATAMGYENYVTSINAEGGNLMADGFEKMFFSSIIPEINADNTVHPFGWTQAQTYDTMRTIFGTPEMVNLKTLKCDGGTGHIDLYVKLVDEQTLIVSQYPAEITAQDRQIIEDNYQYMTTLKSTYNRPFRILRVEHPTDDNGNHTRKTCTQLNADARNFINGLTVNGSFIFPSYYDGSTGNAAQHGRIMDYYKKIFPGYKIVPIDSRILSPLGGAIHCITMQIPVDNPVRFWHPSWDGLVPAQSSYHLTAKITNKSGIQQAQCKWRKNGGTWNTSGLTDSSGYFIGDIAGVSMQGYDSIEYYLEATSVNGKTSTKPLNAPTGGYYKMRLNYLSGTQDYLIADRDHLFNAWPNPATDQVKLSFKLASPALASLLVFDLNGKMVFAEEGMFNEGIHESTWNVASLSQGMYISRLMVDGKEVMNKKIIIQK